MLLIVPFVINLLGMYSLAEMKLLAPQPDEFIRIDEFIIALSLPDETDRVRMFLDEKELLPLKRTAATVTFVPDEQFFGQSGFEGPHRLTIKRYGSFSEKLEESSCIVYLTTYDSISPVKKTAMINKGAALAAAKPVVKPQPYHNGRVATWFEHETFQDSGRTIAEADAWGNGGVGEIRFDYNSTLRTDEQTHSQSLQRFRGAIAYRSITRLSLGDNWPTYHQSILRQQRVRGLELSIKTPHEMVGLDFVMGETNRPIKPFAANPMLLSDAATHNDSVAAMASGTYGRSLKALRLSFNAPNLLSTSITVCKATDDTASINQLTIFGSLPSDSSLTGATPMDNLVYGADARLKLFRGKTELYGSFAMSFLTSDISGGSFSKDELGTYLDADAFFIKPKHLSRLFIINETTIPLPLPTDSSESVNMNALGSAVDWDAGLRISLPISGTRSRADIKYYYTGPNYASLGNPYLTVDRAGWLVSAESQVWDGRFSLRGKLNLYDKDLLEISSSPTRVISTSVSGNLNINSSLPSIMIMTAISDEQGRITTVNDDDFSNNYYSLGGSLQYAPRLGMVKPSVNLSYSTTETEIATAALATPFAMRSHTMSLAISTLIDNIQFEPCAAMVLNAITDDVPLTLLTGNAGVRWHIIPQLFVSDLLFGYSGTDDPNVRDRNEYSVKTGTRYELSKKNTLWVDGSLKWSNDAIPLSYRFKFNYEVRF